MENLKYPIGEYKPQEAYSKLIIDEQIKSIKCLPESLKNKVQGLLKRDELLQYRDGGWNIKQLVHHIGESHTNAYIRIKLALTEDNPTIKPYDENLWINTKENEILDMDVSLNLIEAIHSKMATLLESLTQTEMERTYFHPQYQKTSKIRDLVSLYSWHGKHHLAHIQLALNSKSI